MALRYTLQKQDYILIPPVVTHCLHSLGPWSTEAVTMRLSNQWTCAAKKWNGSSWGSASRERKRIKGQPTPAAIFRLHPPSGLPPLSSLLSTLSTSTLTCLSPLNVTMPRMSTGSKTSAARGRGRSTRAASTRAGKAGKG